MTTTDDLYRAELARIRVDEWDARTVEVLLLEASSSYVFDPTDLYVADVLASGGIEGAWTGYTRQSVTLSTPTVDGSERWQLLASTVDFGIIGTSTSDGTVGAIFYEPITNDADSLLIRCVITAPYVEIWDGSTNFRLTVPGTGFARVRCA